MKSPGDAVEEGEAILEVETDKATMEVPADAAGWLAATFAEAGDDVPVGEVIAIISPEKPAKPVARSRGEAPATGAPSPVAEKRDATNDQGPATTVRSAPPTSAATGAGGRILASPKARRLAKERGLDLGRLAEAGHRQPFHVADLEALAELPSPGSRAQSGDGPAAMGATHRLEARLPAAAWDAFAAWAQDESVAPPLAELATGALRSASRADHVVVRLERPGDPVVLRLDADFGGHPASEEERPAMIVRDLTRTRITGVALGAPTAPVLTVARDRESLVLTLEALPDAMGSDTLLQIVTELAERLEDPLRQLL